MLLKQVYEYIQLSGELQCLHDNLLQWDLLYDLVHAYMHLIIIIYNLLL